MRLQCNPIELDINNDRIAAQGNAAHRSGGGGWVGSTPKAAGGGGPTPA
jgi:hypothetical protein